MRRRAHVLTGLPMPPFGSARVVSSVTQTAMNAYRLR